MGGGSLAGSIRHQQNRAWAESPSKLGGSILARSRRDLLSQWNCPAFSLVGDRIAGPGAHQQRGQAAGWALERPLTLSHPASAGHLVSGVGVLVLNAKGRTPAPSGSADACRANWRPVSRTGLGHCVDRHQPRVETRLGRFELTIDPRARLFIMAEYQAGRNLGSICWPDYRRPAAATRGAGQAPASAKHFPSERFSQ